MKNKLFALALAGVTVIGALATGTPIMATGLSSGGGESSGGNSSSTTGNTTVTLTVPEQQPEGTYEITIPATTTLEKDGGAVALKNGIKVYGSNMTSGVTVTAKSDFKLKADGVDTTVGYGLYANDTDTDTTTSWEFTADEINADNGQGTTKNVYGKVNTEDVANAKAGNYSDTITFAAEVNKAPQMTVDDLFKAGANINIKWTFKDSADIEHHVVVNATWSSDGEYSYTGGTYDGKTLQNTEDDNYVPGDDYYIENYGYQNSGIVFYFYSDKKANFTYVLNPNGEKEITNRDGYTVTDDQVSVNGVNITELLKSTK